MHIDQDSVTNSNALKNSGLSFLKGRGNFILGRPLTRCSQLTKDTMK